MALDLNKIILETDINKLEEYSKKSNSKIREVVARNTNINYDIAKRLSIDKVRAVRLALASNPKCPLSILIDFAFNDDYFVKSGLAKNSAATIEILNHLCLYTKNFAVMNAAEKHFKILDIVKEICKSTDVKILENYAKTTNSLSVAKAIINHSLCTDDIFKILSENKNAYIRLEIAESKKCSTDILKKLREDPVEFVRNAVAGNLNADAGSISKLSDDEDVFVLLGVAQNPKSTTSDLEKILSKKIKDTYVLHEIYHHCNCPADFKKQVDKMHNQTGYMIREGWQ